MKTIPVGQEMARLQGVGSEDWYRYEMGSVCSTLMRDMIGNGFP